MQQNVAMRDSTATSPDNIAPDQKSQLSLHLIIAHASLRKIERITVK